MRKKKKGMGGGGCVRAESAPAPYLKAVAFNSGIILAVCVVSNLKPESQMKQKKDKCIFSNYR